MLNSFIESQIFFPERSMAGDPGDLGLAFQDVEFAASDGARLHGWHIPAAGRHLMVFYHGNAGNISHRLDNLVRLHHLGVEVFIFDYRGYGKSQGRISEQGLYLDAAAARDWGAETAGRGGKGLVLFGRSLGGVAAVAAAEGAPRVDGMILESTFTNLGDMAKVHFPLPGLGRLSGRFDSLGRISRLTAPMLFIHGESDDIVPYVLGRRLYEAAQAPKEFFAIPGAGHNDTYLVGGRAYFQRIADFLGRLEEKP